MSAIRIFRWADAPDEYQALVKRRDWLAFVPTGKTLDTKADVRWSKVLTAKVEGGKLIAGNDG